VTEERTNEPTQEPTQEPAREPSPETGETEAGQADEDEPARRVRRDRPAPIYGGPGAWGGMRAATPPSIDD